MKPIYEKLLKFPEEGFALKELHGASCDCPWHFHAEYELILVLRSQGYRIVGDQMTSLAPGDLVFLGANVPHLYQHHDQLSGSCRTSEPAHCLLIQFDDRSWGGFLDLPAFAGVRGLFRRAALGLQVTHRTRDRVATMMKTMVGLKGVERIGRFLTILDTLARSRSCRPIASPGFGPVLNAHDEKRVNAVWEYIQAHFHRPISLAEVARLVHMSEGGFSRFFHSHLGKTFPAFVNEMRIGRACRLLTETEMSVTEVALACGYANLSNFNRQFLSLKKITPRGYRKRMGPAR